MDMYFGNSDPLSLQEMLDIDIKSEIDTLIGGNNDLSGFNFTDLPPLEMDDVSDIRWFSHNSNMSNSSFTLDFSGDDYTTMVDPNAVMPIISSISANTRSPSPSLKESHLTFSPASIKPNGISVKTEVAAVKKDLIKKLDDGNITTFKLGERPSIKIDKPQTINVVNAVINRNVGTQHFIKKSATGPIINTIKKVTPIISKGIVKVTKTPLLSFRNTVGGRQIASPVTVAQLANLGQVRTISTAPVNHTRKQQFNNNRIFAEDVKPFPKPAYSYSCLIAMALKNSKTGSLPVSEIYNFMCRHFPFFKTAPNGWKNSVRHNLSLNKCFEKIEKPAVNGAQRKGCLWAMNESKITKMDEEVQKWSKKDPSAIRRAMSNPSNLEALERGELKFSCSYESYEDNFGDSCGSAESDGSEYESEMDTTPTTKIIHAQPQYINIANIKTELKQEVDDEEDEEEEEETDEFDVEVADSLYDDEIVDDEDSEILHMEMALAQKELLEYDPSVRRRKNIYIIQN